MSTVSPTLYYSLHQTPIGRLVLVASEKGMQAIDLLEETSGEWQWLEDFQKQRKQQPLHNPGFFQEATQALDAYFKHRTPLRLKFHFTWGTDLQRKVWQAIADIPFGDVQTYSQIAEKAGAPHAVRAVAGACGANPIPILVPCHRVVGKNGKLGGFSMAGGVDIKKRLLALEAPDLQLKAA